MCVFYLDYVRLLNLGGQVKTARRHSVVDMQFEFRIEALGKHFSHECFCRFCIYRLSSIICRAFCSPYLILAVIFLRSMSQMTD